MDFHSFSYWAKGKFKPPIPKDTLSGDFTLRAWVCIPPWWMIERPFFPVYMNHYYVEVDIEKTSTWPVETDEWYHIKIERGE